MKKTLLILGIIFLVLGILGLSYDQITLQKTGQSEIGPFALKYPRYHTYHIPRWLSGGLIVIGGLLVIFNLRGRGK